MDNTMKGNYDLRKGIICLLYLGLSFTLSAQSWVIDWQGIKNAMPDGWEISHSDTITADHGAWIERFESEIYTLKDNTLNILPENATCTDRGHIRPKYIQSTLMHCEPYYEDLICETRLIYSGCNTVNYECVRCDWWVTEKEQDLYEVVWRNPDCIGGNIELSGMGGRK